MVTRREFLSIAAVAGLDAASGVVSVPVHQLVDRHARWTPARIQAAWSPVWAQAVRDFAACGVRLDCGVGEGDIRRTPAGQPLLTGLNPAAINLVLTDYIPLAWDNGRALSGVSTRYHGYRLCMIAVSQAHCHQIPLLSVNTCVHEFLHVFLDDVSEGRPKGFLRQAREARVDLYATRLWLFRDGSTIHKAAQECAGRLRARQVC